MCFLYSLGIKGNEFVVTTNSFLKVQVLEFLKINFKKEEVLYEIFKDVDPVGIFNYKYICISGLHKDMKKSPKNSC